MTYTAVATIISLDKQKYNIIMSKMYLCSFKNKYYHPNMNSCGEVSSPADNLDKHRPLK